MSRIGRNDGIEIRTRLVRVADQAALKLPARTASYRPVTTIISFPFIGNFVIDESQRSNGEKLSLFLSLVINIIGCALDGLFFPRSFFPVKYRWSFMIFLKVVFVTF